MWDMLQPFTEGLEEYDASSPTPKAGGGPKHEVDEEQSLDEKLPSGVTDAGRDTLAKDTKSKKGTSVPNHDETTMRSFFVLKTPIVKSVRRQEQHESGVE